LKGIEIISSPSGAPTVKLYGHAADVAGALGIEEVKISITHSGELALCVAFAM
jgi:fatty acid synthase subunit alpha